VLSIEINAVIQELANWDQVHPQIPPPPMITQPIVKPPVVTPPIVTPPPVVTPTTVGDWSVVASEAPKV
jgi:hypothetical protein